MARGLGEREIVPLLQENLADEKEALRALERVGRRLAKDGKPGTRTGRARSANGRRLADACR